MRVTIDSTDKLVTLEINGSSVPARIWQGHTESGIPVHCYVTRIVPEIPESHPAIGALTADFEIELKRQATPRDTVTAIPLRLIL